MSRATQWQVTHWRGLACNAWFSFVVEWWDKPVSVQASCSGSVSRVQFGCDVAGYATLGYGTFRIVMVGRAVVSLGEVSPAEFR